VIPLYKPVKIVLGILFTLFALAAMIGKQIVIAAVFALVAFLAFRSAYYHGKYEPPLFRRKL
jgi:hypothetical protein